ARSRRSARSRSSATRSTATSASGARPPAQRQTRRVASWGVVLHRMLLVGVLSAALSAAAATDAPVPSELMPGVTLQTQVQFTAHGPVVVHVITAPKPGGLYSLTPVLAHGVVNGGIE